MEHIKTSVDINDDITWLRLLQVLTELANSSCGVEQLNLGDFFLLYVIALGGPLALLQLVDDHVILDLGDLDSLVSAHFSYFFLDS